MQHNPWNYIPTWAGKKFDIIGKDSTRLLVDQIREKNNTIIDSEWKKERMKTYIIEQNAIELAENIWNNSSLYSSSSQPSWYPPVPEIVQSPICSQNTNIKNKKEGSADFIRDNISICIAPMSVEEFDMECISLISIDPSILRNTIIHEKDVDIITGNIVSQNFSYPIITRHIGYLVNLLSNWQSVELTSIYAYSNKNLLGNLIEFIKDLEVSNTWDLLRARRYIEDAYTQLR